MKPIDKITLVALLVAAGAYIGNNWIKSDRMIDNYISNVACAAEKKYPAGKKESVEETKTQSLEARLAMWDNLFLQQVKDGKIENNLLEGLRKIAVEYNARGDSYYLATVRAVVEYTRKINELKEDKTVKNDDFKVKCFQFSIEFEKKMEEYKDLIKKEQSQQVPLKPKKQIKKGKIKTSGLGLNSDHKYSFNPKHSGYAAHAAVFVQNKNYPRINLGDVTDPRQLPYYDYFKEASEKTGAPIEILYAMVHHETGGTFDPEIPGNDGEIGLAQYMLATYEEMRKKNPSLPPAGIGRKDPEVNINSLAKDLVGYQKAYKNWYTAILSHNSPALAEKYYKRKQTGKNSKYVRLVRQIIPEYERIFHQSKSGNKSFVISSLQARQEGL